MHIFKRPHITADSRRVTRTGFRLDARLQRPVLILGFILSALSVSSTATAQLVQIGPGYVRAPFVRVYNYADGSSFVRAPFVSVFSPPRFWEPPRYTYARPVYPEPIDNLTSARSNSQTEISGLDLAELRKVALDNLALLDGRLNDSWREYLDTELLEDILAERGSLPLQEQQIEQLKEIRSNFEATMNSPEFRQISEAPGFRELNAALAELSLTARERKLRQLSATKLLLDDDLARIKASESWQEYLQLPTESTPDELEAALRRYDDIADDSKYRRIADLPAFQSTRLRLHEYLELVNGPSTTSTAPSMEQLPLPPPAGTTLEPAAD